MAAGAAGLGLAVCGLAGLRLLLSRPVSRCRSEHRAVPGVLARREPVGMQRPAAGGPLDSGSSYPAAAADPAEDWDRSDPGSRSAMISDAFSCSLIAAASAPVDCFARCQVLLLLRREARLGGGDHQHFVQPVKMGRGLHNHVDEGVAVRIGNHLFDHAHRQVRAEIPGRRRRSAPFRRA